MMDDPDSLDHYALPAISGIFARRKTEQEFLRDLMTADMQVEASLHEEAALPQELQYLAGGRASHKKGSRHLHGKHEQEGSREASSRKAELKQAIRRGLFRRHSQHAAERGDHGDRFYAVALEAMARGRRPICGGSAFQAAGRHGGAAGARTTSKERKMPWHEIGMRLEDKIRTSPLAKDVDKRVFERIPSAASCASIPFSVSSTASSPRHTPYVPIGDHLSAERQRNPGKEQHRPHQGMNRHNADSEAAHRHLVDQEVRDPMQRGLRTLHTRIPAAARGVVSSGNVRESKDSNSNFGLATLSGRSQTVDAVHRTERPERRLMQEHVEGVPSSADSSGLMKSDHTQAETRPSTSEAEGMMAVRGHHRKPENRRHLRFLLECSSLKGEFLDSRVDSKCVVSVADEMLSKKGKYLWMAEGETELSRGTIHPSWQKTVKIEYDSAFSKYIRFDVFTSETGSLEFESQHIGACVLEIRELLANRGKQIHKHLERSGHRNSFGDHLEFDAVRILRERFTANEILKAFKSRDSTETRDCNLDEFRKVLQRLFAVSGYKYSPNVATEKLFAAYRREIAEKSVTRDTLQPHPPASAKLSQGRKLDSDGWMQEVTRDAEGARHSFAVKALALYSRSKLPRQLHRASYGEPIKSRLNKGQIGSITASQELALIDEPSRRFSTTWSRTHKAAGIVISNFPDCSVAHSNPLPFTGGFASVRSDAPIPDVAYIDNLYIEFVLRHPGAHDGSSLQGPYTVGLQTVHAQPKPQLVPSPADASSRTRSGEIVEGSVRGTGVRETAEDGMRGAEGSIDILPGGGSDSHIVKDKDFGSWWGVSVSKPADFHTGWSFRYRGPRIQILEGGNAAVATLGDDGRVDEEARTTDNDMQFEVVRVPLMSAESVRASEPAPKGASYFETVFRAPGQPRGASLGGGCFVGLVSKEFQRGGWTGDWTRDERRTAVWGLPDGAGGTEGLLSTLGIPFDDESGGAIASAKQALDRKLRDLFVEHDMAQTGLLGRDAVFRALDALGIHTTDAELDVLAAPMAGTGERNAREGSDSSHSSLALSADDFFALVHAKAAPGTVLEAGEAREWVPNSFFGVGDRVGFQVDTVKRTATIFKNGQPLGTPFTGIPETVFPFATISQPRTQVVLEVSSNQRIAARSELISGNVRRPFVEGSYFASGDRVGLLLSPIRGVCVRKGLTAEERRKEGEIPRLAVDLYINGSFSGRAFDDLSADQPLYAFASLCHSGAQAMLAFPPPPNQGFQRRIEESIAQQGIDVEETISPNGGALQLFAQGNPVPLARLDVSPLPGLGIRGLSLSVAAVSSAFNRDALVVRDARLVSSVVQVTQHFGPSVWGRSVLRIQHCASSKAELLFAFMPLASAGSSFRVAFHRVDEIAADVKWSRGMGCARIDRPGYYVILSLSPTLQDADLVRIEYSLTQQSFVSDPLSMLAANASCDAVGLRAFGEEAGLAPRFATVKIGSELHATIRLVAASAEAVGCGGDANVVQIQRGQAFSQVRGEASAQDGNFDFEVDGVGGDRQPVSDTTAFFSKGCALWLKSYFGTQIVDSSREALSLEKVQGTSLSDVEPRWLGVPMELDFKVTVHKAEAPKEPRLFHMWRRTEFNHLISDFNWEQIQVVLDPHAGIVGWTPYISSEKSKLSSQPLNASAESCVVSGENRDARSEMITIAKISTVQYEVVSFAPSVLCHGLRLWEQDSDTEAPAMQHDHMMRRSSMRSVGRRGSVRMISDGFGGLVRAGELILATGAVQDRDGLLSAIRMCNESCRPSPATQQVLLDLALAPAHGDPEHHRPVPLCPLVVCVLDRGAVSE